jgi:hypothetical protein
VSTIWCYGSIATLISAASRRSIILVPQLCIWALVIANVPIWARVPDFWTLVIADNPGGQRNATMS